MRRAAIVGPGRVGTALALALRGEAIVLGAAGGRDGSQQLFQQRTGVPLWDDAKALCKGADWVFLTVPDRSVVAVAESLASQGAFHSGQVVCHTAGSLDNSALRAAAAHGSATVALHPMQSVADPTLGRAAFTGAVCTLQGDEGAVTDASVLVEALGMRPWRVSAHDKARLHAASVLASNALLGLLALAAETAAGSLDREGRDLALSALLPLCRGTLQNVSAMGLPAALTGPVERGDVSTVQRHLGLLQGDALVAYRAFLPVLVRLGREKGSLQLSRASALLDLVRR